MQSLTRRVKSYVKCKNEFLIKFRFFLNLPNDIILCTDDVGVYPNIQNDGFNS